MMSELTEKIIDVSNEYPPEEFIEAIIIILRATIDLIEKQSPESAEKIRDIALQTIKA